MMTKELQQHQARLEESVRPIIRLVMNQLVDHEGAKPEDLDAAASLGAALALWDQIDQVAGQEIQG